MGYQDFIVRQPRVQEVATDILCVEFWKKEFCDVIIQKSDEINCYESNYNDPVPGQELRIDKISPEFYISFCKHWKYVLQPILDKYYMLPAKQWFSGWKIPFVIKYEIGKQTYLRPHMDDSLITGTIKLNDDYEGGELTFPRQNYNTKNVPVGSIVLFPASINHIHYSSELKRGKKYSLIAWTKVYPNQQGISYDEV